MTNPIDHPSLVDLLSRELAARRARIDVDADDDARRHADRCANVEIDTRVDDLAREHAERRAVIDEQARDHLRRPSRP